MKCLRCGREMKDEDECTCGHFYENNLNKSKRRRKKKKPMLDIIATIIIIGIFILLAYHAIVQEINNHNRNIEDFGYCEIVCEGSSYTIEGTNCICGNGEKYPIK